MDDYVRILKKLGLVLVIVGLCDIGIMIYCITNGIGYSSSLNIFAVIAGTFLLKGSLRVAGYVAFFSAFMLAGFVGILPMIFLFEPLELRLVRFELYPIATFLTYALTPIVILFIYWVYRQVTNDPVLAARKTAGMSYRKPKLAFAIGGLLAVTLSVAIYPLNHGDKADMAKVKATEVYGKEYSYSVTAMNFSGGHVHARLTAYKDDEIKEVKVDW